MRLTGDENFGKVEMWNPGDSGWRLNEVESPAVVLDDPFDGQPINELEAAALGAPVKS